jgi:hypothetical protein
VSRFARGERFEIALLVFQMSFEDGAQVADRTPRSRRVVGRGIGVDTRRRGGSLVEGGQHLLVLAAEVADHRLVRAE